MLDRVRAPVDRRVPCGGITRAGYPCGNGKKLPIAEAERGWFCHFHRQPDSPQYVLPNRDQLASGTLGSFVLPSARTSDWIPTSVGGTVPCGGITKAGIPCKKVKKLSATEAQDGWFCFWHKAQAPDAQQYVLRNRDQLVVSGALTCLISLPVHFLTVY